MKHSRISVRSALVVVIGAIMLVAASMERTMAADKIRIAVTNFNMAFLPAGIAVKKVFFKDEGLDAEVIRMTGNIAIAALAAGDVDYTMIFGSVVRAAMRGLPLKVVASFIDGSTHALVARPEYRTIRDLKGKTIGLQAFGTSDHVAGVMMLKKFGVDPDKDVKMLGLGSAPARLAALKEGVVEAVIVSPPTDAEAKNLGFNLVSRAYEVFSFPFVGLGTNLRKLKERPNEVKRTIKALIRANRYLRENREGTIQTLVEWGRTTPELAAAAYDSSWKVYNLDGNIPEEGLLAVIDQAAKEMKLTREVPPSEVADISFLRDAQRELGIKLK